MNNSLIDEELQALGPHCELHDESLVDGSLHRHNDIEVVFVSRGAMSLLLGGNVHRVVGPAVALFWAARPHNWFEMTPDTVRTFLDVPLAWFMNWGLPDAFRQRVLGGAVLVHGSEQRARFDEMSFAQWSEDLDRGDAEYEKAALVEIHGRVRRMSLESDTGTQCEPGASRDADAVPIRSMGGDLRRIVEMTQFIAENYIDPIAVHDVAEAADLHPNYAMTLFHKKTGLTIMEYVTRQRVAHAQLLLVTTSTKVVDIAFHSGFGSSSRFYSAFKDACGMTPSEYRRATRTKGRNTPPA